MEFKDKDGKDLLPFKTQEEAFNHWARSTKGRPCDYTGMTYAKLTGGSGIQWPCNEQYPNGRPRLVSQYRDSSRASRGSYNRMISTMTASSSPNPRRQKASGTIWSSVGEDMPPRRKLSN